MDFQLMQWGNQQQQQQQQQQQLQLQQQQSEHQQKHQIGEHVVGIDRKQDQQQQQQSLSALPLFLTEPVSKVGNNMSVHPDLPSTSKFPKMMMMGGQFSSAQWQELELQAVIFRYMLAGASVPAVLLQPIKNSLLNSSSFFLHHPLQHFSHYQPAAAAALLQSGYWGRAGMDPEPGRCRRTDGKKWRCSRDVAPGHKYCERHMNRGRNRSRKPVEIPKPRTMTPTNCINASGGELGKTADPMMASPLGTASRAHFSPFGGPVRSIDLMQLNQRSSNILSSSKSDLNQTEILQPGTSDGRVLRRFFDDWPRPMEESGYGGIHANPIMGSSTSLSMSLPGSTASDVSLKLATGSGSEDASAVERDRMQLNWMAQWGQHQAGPMGGPLAEALRSSFTTTASPTSVLHELAR